MRNLTQRLADRTYHFFVYFLFFITVGAADSAATPVSIQWNLDATHLRRTVTTNGLTTKRTSWKRNRISWFPFIAWEEKRLGSDSEKIVWVDTPHKIHHTKIAGGRVRSVKGFQKGQPIPQELRPKGEKTLWVILEKQLVRKVLIGDDVASEFRYRKTHIPLFPFIAAKESALDALSFKTLQLETPNRNVIIRIEKKQLSSYSVNWKNARDHYDLPDAETGELIPPAEKTEKKDTVEASRHKAPAKPAAKPVRTAAKPAAKPVKRVTSPIPEPAKPAVSPVKSAVQTIPARETMPARETLSNNHSTVSPVRPQSSCPHWQTSSITGRTVVSLLQQGRFRDGLNLAIAKRKSQPGNSELLFLEGIACAWCGNLKRATTLLKKATARNKSYKLPLAEVAIILAIQGKASQGLDILKTIPKNHRPPRFNLATAVNHFVARDFEKSFREALTSTSEDSSPERLFIAARCAQLMGNTSQALDNYRELLSICPVNYHCLLPHPVADLADFPQMLRKPELQQKQPVNLFYLSSIHYGALEFSMQNYKRASEGFSKACLINGESREMLFNCATAMEKSGNKKDAISLYRRLVSSPEFEDIALKRLQQLDGTSTTQRQSIYTPAFSETRGFPTRRVPSMEEQFTKEQLKKSRGLDRLFNTVKSNMRKTTSDTDSMQDAGSIQETSLSTNAEPEDASSIEKTEQKSLLSIRQSTTRLRRNGSRQTSEHVVSPHRNEGLEIRYGGKGEEPGLNGAVVRLTPRFNFPKHLSDHTQNTFSLSFKGTVETGQNTIVVVRLRVTYPFSPISYNTVKTYNTSEQNPADDRSIDIGISANSIQGKIPRFTVVVETAQTSTTKPVIALESRTILNYEGN